MGYTSSNAICLQTASALSTPLASQTYYFGLFPIAIQGGTTVAIAGKIFMPCPGVIRQVTFLSKYAVGSSDATTLSIRKNNTTDTVLSSTLDFSATPLEFNYAVNIPFVKDDYFSFKLVTPAWASPPTNVYMCTVIYCTTG